MGENDNINISQNEIDELLGAESATAAQVETPAATAPPPNIEQKEAAPEVDSPVESAGTMAYQPLSPEKLSSGEALEITLIKEIPLEISVELGRIKKSIKEILDFGLGTVIELDRLAGEPVDIMANGKIIGRGEVVVIDDNFAVRITQIINPDADD